jgi:hypothetical protein
MSKAYKGMTKIVAETNTGGPYIYMENPYTGTIGAKGETWAEQIIYVVDAVETAVERHFEAENERFRAALREIASDDLYMRNGASWHDVAKMQDGVRQIAREALGYEE